MSKILLQPIQTLHAQISRFPALLHGAAAIGVFMLLGLSNLILDASYTASQFPVPYAVGQTTFDGELLKSYYQHMIDAGSLGTYWQTQFIDFGFIASMFLVGLIIPTFPRRFAGSSSWAYRILTWSATLIPMGAIFDAIENLISFTMLAQPQSFANWIALPYSAMAATKFACIGLGILTLLIGLIALIVHRIRRWMPRQQQAA